MDFTGTQFIKSIGFSEELSPSSAKEVCFCGRSNVGKSSLLNVLCRNKSLARVGNTPGKTTTVNFFSAGEGYLLVDLPGYGYARRSHKEKERWADLMEYYFNSGRNIILAVMLLDMRHNPSSEDMQMLDFLVQTNTPYIVVLTKKDKLNKTEQKQNLEDFSLLLKPFRPIAILPFSIQDNDSAGDIRIEIDKAIKRKK